MKQTTNHKPQSFISRFLLLFVLAVSFSNCQVEEDAVRQENSIQTVSLNEAISFVRQNPLNSSSKTGKKKTFTPDFDAITQEKITNSDQLITVIPLYSNTKQEYSRILLLKIKDSIKSVLFSMYPEDTSQNDSFSGKIYIYSLDGDFINGFRVKKNNIISQFVKSNRSIKNSVTNRSYGEELNEVIILNHRSTSLELSYFSWDVPTNDGGGNYESIMWDYGGSGGGGEVAPAEVIEDQIKDSLDPCPKGVLDKLKNTTNNDIAAILKKLGANSVYTVTMQMGSTAQGYAQTQKISANNYLITVANDSYTTSTQLFRAAALIHEIIHAYYHSVVDDNVNPTTNLSLNNFSALYQAYELKIYPGGATVAQHDQMAKDYVDSMAMALQEYYINNQPLVLPLASYEVFTDLAWGTLQESSVFNDKYKDGDPVKERILNRYRAESTGQSVETGTTKQQNPIGKPCN